MDEIPAPFFVCAVILKNLNTVNLNCADIFWNSQVNVNV